MSKGALPDPDAEVGKLIDELLQAVGVADIRPDDPMGPLVQSFRRIFRFTVNRIEQSDRTITAASKRIVDAIDQARITADAEQNRFKAGLAVAEVDTISRVGQAIAKSAEVALTKHVQILQWKNVASAAVTLVIIVGASLAVGYKWGDWRTRSQLEQTSEQLNAFSRLNQADARRWAGLMLFNENIKPALDKCLSPGGSFTLDGRKACNFTFWVE